MNNPLAYYTSQKEQLENQFTFVKNNLLNLSMLRFAVFAATCYGMYAAFSIATNVLIIALIGFSLFGFLIVKHTNLQRKRDVIQAELNINITEISVLEGDFSFLPTGQEFVNPLHSFSNDIDLFGVGSFFQYINRTATKEGRKQLVSSLTENSITQIKEKQEALQELSKKVQWRQNFTAIASLTHVKHSTKTVADWIINYMRVFPSFLSKIPAIFSVLSIVFITLISFQVLPFSVLTIWFFLGLFITGNYFKKIHKLYTNADKAKETFRQYHLLLQKIEATTFTAALLKEKQQIIQSENKKASAIFLRFSKLLDAFDQRNNVLIAVLGNALFLRDISIAVQSEKWIIDYKNTVQKWFEVVAFFDAQNSLANVVFNHSDFVFPILKEDTTVLKSEKLGHPLLKKTNRVDNDFTINNKEFYIITGSNMAGKSTFLRTVSLSIVMANIGLPVCAKQFEYTPIKLITSMRTSDSLADDESYFYSELKRLKFIIDEIHTDHYFIILDEILKGTNSKDKATGSKKFVKKLVKSGSTGIIATHDVSLCDLEQEFTEIKNYYFDAEITNNELYFDYTLKQGVCTNMNASFLLEKMKIV